MTGPFPRATDPLPLPIPTLLPQSPSPVPYHSMSLLSLRFAPFVIGSPLLSLRSGYLLSTSIALCLPFHRTTYPCYDIAAGFSIIRGGYHIARSSASSCEAKAQFFLARGGRWSPCMITLPGASNLKGILSTHARGVLSRIF